MLWDENPEHSSLTKEYTEESKELEQKLLPYDILGNIAHVEMLAKQGYIGKEEKAGIVSCLEEIYKEQPTVEAEDVHTFVEEKATEKTEAGKKIHTGRSRNDQVVLDTRLLMKDSMIEIALKALELVKALEGFAGEKNEFMPGYTHQQQAMPSSTGLWASSYADSLIDDLELLKSVFEILDRNPLGAAAGYGTTLDIDREYTAELLGFSSVQENPIYCVNRGKHELMLLQALDQLMLDIEKLSEDLVNFSGFKQIFKIPGDFCTGSSIMPQKQNPDVLELARAKAGEVSAAGNAIRGIIAKLPHGYNRDTQQTKKHLVSALEAALDSLEILTALVKELEVVDEVETSNGIYAADTANKLVEEGTPFREAYKEVKKGEEYVQNKTLKPPANQEYAELEQYWRSREAKFNEVKEDLLGNSFET